MFQIEQIFPQYAGDNDAQLDGGAARGSLHGAVGKRGGESWWGGMRVEQIRLEISCICKINSFLQLFSLE